MIAEYGGWNNQEKTGHPIRTHPKLFSVFVFAVANTKTDGQLVFKRPPPLRAVRVSAEAFAKGGDCDESVGVSDNFRLVLNFTPKHVRHNGIKSLLVNDFAPELICTLSGTKHATVKRNQGYFDLSILF